MLGEQFRVRIIEVDTAHSTGRTDVGHLIGPLVKRTLTSVDPSGIEIKAGDLPHGADPNHISYFIGVRYPAVNDSQISIGESVFRRLLEECRRVVDESKIPAASVVEIKTSRPEYSRLASQFGWADALRLS